MTVDDLLEKMFPGDKNLNVCAFSALGRPVETWLDSECLGVVEKALAELAGAIEGLSDINDILKILRKSEAGAVRQFMVSALEVYFSAPEVVTSVTGGPAPLFPNQRVLPEIDYDLLGPVLEHCEAGEV